MTLVNMRMPEAEIIGKPIKSSPYYQLNSVKRNRGVVLHDTGLTFDQFVSAHYLPYIKIHQKSWRMTESFLRRFASPALGACRLKDIQRLQLLNLLEGLISAGKKVSSVRRIKAALTGMFNYAELEGYIPFGQSPCYKLPFYNDSSPKEPYHLAPKKREKLLELLEADNSVYALALMLLIMTGARKNEIVAAKWKDVDWENRRLRSGRLVHGKVRYIDLADEAMKILEKLPSQNSSEWLFPGRNEKKPLSDLFLYWKQLREKIGCGDMKIEDLRYINISKDA